MRVDTGFMGSIIKLWIKYAHVEKPFSSKLISFIERSTVVKNAFINIMAGKVVLNINWLRKIQLLLRKVTNHGIQDLQERVSVNQHQVLLKRVRGEAKKQNFRKILRQAIKIFSGKGTQLGTVLYILGFTGDWVKPRSVINVIT